MCETEGIQGDHVRYLQLKVRWYVGMRETEGIQRDRIRYLQLRVRWYVFETEGIMEWPYINIRFQCILICT